MGSLRNRDCGQKAPRTLSVVPLFGGRRLKFFFSLELRLPNKKLWFFVVTIFFCFKRFCTPSLTLGRNATGGGGVGAGL